MTSRTFNDSGIQGTLGQYIPSFSVLGPDFRQVVFLAGLRGDSNGRTNVGIVNPNDWEITAILKILAPAGDPVGDEVMVVVPAHSVAQTNRVNERAGARNLQLFSVEAWSQSPFLAYASKLDNATSDPIFLPGGFSARSRQWIDGVASAPGAAGTFFRSSLSLTNRSGGESLVQVALTSRGELQSMAQDVVRLQQGESVFFEDVLAELFQIDGQLSPVAGALSILTTEDRPVVAWGRTYSDRGNAGTFGQAIPAFGPENLFSGEAFFTDFRRTRPLARTWVSSMAGGSRPRSRFPLGQLPERFSERRHSRCCRGRRFSGRRFFASSVPREPPTSSSGCCQTFPAPFMRGRLRLTTSLRTPPSSGQWLGSEAEVNANFCARTLEERAEIESRKDSSLAAQLVSGFERSAPPAQFVDSWKQ